jgi:hypothetical protein
MEQKKRKSFRFKAEPGTLVSLQKLSSSDKFTGIAINESYRGCSFVMVTKDPFQKGDQKKVKVGKLAALLAEVRWAKDLKDSILMMGVEFFEEKIKKTRITSSDKNKLSLNL